MVNNQDHNVLVGNTLLICQHKTIGIDLLDGHLSTILLNDVRIHSTNKSTIKQKMFFNLEIDQKFG